MTQPDIIEKLASVSVQFTGFLKDAGYTEAQIATSPTLAVLRSAREELTALRARLSGAALPTQECKPCPCGEWTMGGEAITPPENSDA